MLILASVTVNVAINGGLFEYAGKAKHATEDVREKEFIKEAVIIAEGNSKTGRITVEEMQKALNKVAGEGVATAINNGDTVVIQFNDSKTYYEVNEKGEVGDSIEIVFDTKAGELDGTGTETDPYVIMSIEDLVYFSQQVNIKNKEFDGKYVELGKTLDFKSDLSYVNINTTDYDEFLGGDGETGLKEQLTKGLGFMPINNFSGTFDGQNNWIKNIYINKESDSVALFGTAGFTNSIFIKDLNITGEITGLKNVGGFWGTAYNAACDIKIINCNNYVNVKGTTYVGGIAGNGIGFSAQNCNNYGKIKATGEAVEGAGGIVGVNGKTSRCANYGLVEGNIYVGGICGCLSSNYIFECVNEGKILGNERVGGICGFAGNGGYVDRCYNIGKVTGNVRVGGIAGFIWRESHIKCAYNEGEIVGEENVGGIIGDRDWADSAAETSMNCYNIGQVTGNKNVGQVIGKKGADKIENLYYLNTTSTKGIGNVDDIEGIVEGKTAAELKADDLLGVLNVSHTHNVDGTDVDYTAKCWVKDTKNINSGYPILSWQVD